MPRQATYPAPWASGTLLPAPMGTATASKQGWGQTQPRSPQRHPGDAPAPGMKERPCPGPSAEASCCRGPPPSSEGPAGPEDKRGEDGHVPGSGEAHRCPGYALLPWWGWAGGLGSHFCVCRASQDRPSLNIVTARVATCERGEEGGLLTPLLPSAGRGQAQHDASTPARLLEEQGAEGRCHRAQNYSTP